MAVEAAMRGDGGGGDGHEHDVVMPGFRFHPTEEELIEFYLRRKVEGKRFNVELITFLDLYHYDPWELPGLESSLLGAGVPMNLAYLRWSVLVVFSRNRNGQKAQQLLSSAAAGFALRRRLFLVSGRTIDGFGGEFTELYNLDRRRRHFRSDDR
ncbi:hypothetical protein BHE74_00037486 [Ensete ventricosum]|nr:hypothetical protein BHE74_00037486 [Ensete ventricosum]RZS03476.1 hypothetical protein BHM03_00033657 [Ensete ventricosum]